MDRGAWRATVCGVAKTEQLVTQPAHTNPWASLVAQLAKNLPAMQETLVRFLGWEYPLEKDRLPTPVFLGFPGGSDSKESTYNAVDLGSAPGLGRSLQEGMATHSSILA